MSADCVASEVCGTGVIWATVFGRMAKGAADDGQVEPGGGPGSRHGCRAGRVLTASSWLSDLSLRRLSDPAVFERGRVYAERGLVDLEEVEDDYVAATVHGSHSYSVELADEGDGAVTWACTCPHASDGAFCKHLVAAGLAAIASTGPGRDVGAAAHDERPQIGIDDLREWVASQDSSVLADIVLHACEHDDDLRNALLLRVAAERGVHPQMQGYRRRLRDAFATGDFVPWREMASWTADIQDALDTIQPLLEQGYADAAISLAAEAWAHLESAYGRVDDSNGELMMIGDRIADLHLAACAAASAPVQLAAAERLFTFAIDSELDTFRDRLREYRKPLGDEAWDALRRAAQAEWDRVPARGPGDADADRYGRRFRITQVMEALADDDIDGLLAVRSKSLAHPYDWVRIVETCAAAGRDDLAVEWGERGMEAFGPDTDRRLGDALSDAYVRTGRLAEALALELDQFASAPGANRYVRLRVVATRLGRWDEEREHAHVVARAHVEAAQRQVEGAQRTSAWFEPPSSLIVSLFLEDGDVDAAWAEAITHGCSQQLWLRLAASRAEDHPGDAIEVYRVQLLRALEPAKDRAYAEVVQVLQTLAPLYQRDARPQEFQRLVADIRSEYKRRSNLIKHLDRAKL